jgi:dihydroorotate dehydrogenase electron transfer subunit
VSRTTDLPRGVRVARVQREAPDFLTLWFEGDIAFEPGQFVMLWLPRNDEKPFAVSWAKDGRFAVTVRRRGPFTRRLWDLKPGDVMGVRGPYGRGFQPREPMVIVAGGVGIATVAPLKERCPSARLIYGARTASELIWRGRFPDMTVCTDDGSEGYHGFPTDLLREVLEARRVALVCACGPEPMMRAVFDLCERLGVECQASLERYMKCGFGVCAQCLCDDRLVCLDGPVFSSDTLRGLKDFGRAAMFKSGRVVDVGEYARYRTA